MSHVENPAKKDGQLWALFPTAHPQQHTANFLFPIFYLIQHPNQHKNQSLFVIFEIPFQDRKSSPWICIHFFPILILGEVLGNP